MLSNLEKSILYILTAQYILFFKTQSDFFVFYLKNFLKHIFAKFYTTMLCKFAFLCLIDVVDFKRCKQVYVMILSMKRHGQVLNNANITFSLNIPNHFSNFYYEFI